MGQDLSEPGRILVFWHLPKCMGSAVRSIFNNKRWALLPYCSSENAVLKRHLPEMLGTHPSGKRVRIFWENHCHSSIYGAPAVLSSIQARLPSKGRAPAVIAFTILRHPVDLARSYYEYFVARQSPVVPARLHKIFRGPGPSLHEWARNQSELMLFGQPGYGGHGFFGLSPQGPRVLADGTNGMTNAACHRHVHEALHALAAMDHVGFMESPASVARIVEYAAWPGQLPHDNRLRITRVNSHCRQCHEYGAAITSDGERVMDPTDRLLRHANWCSLRVYEAARSRYLGLTRPENRRTRVTVGLNKR